MADDLFVSWGLKVYHDEEYKQIKFVDGKLAWKNSINQKGTKRDFADLFF